jgi:hypothetical protein
MTVTTVIGTGRNADITGHLSPIIEVTVIDLAGALSEENLL